MRRSLNFTRNYATKQTTTSTGSENPVIRLRQPELRNLAPIPPGSPRHISVRRTEPASVGHLVFGQPVGGKPLDPQHPLLRGGGAYRKCPSASSNLFTAKLIPYGLLSHVELEKMPPFEPERVNRPNSSSFGTTSSPEELGSDFSGGVATKSDQVTTLRLGPEGEKIRYRVKQNNPNAIYLSLLVVVSKAANHKDAVIRRKTAKRIREALKLIITRGAKASDDGLSIVFKSSDIDKEKWLVPDCSYILFSKIEAFKAPWPTLITTLRTVLVELRDGMTKLLHSINVSKSVPITNKSSKISNKQSGSSRQLHSSNSTAKATHSIKDETSGKLSLNTETKATTLMAEGPLNQLPSQTDKSKSPRSSLPQRNGAVHARIPPLVGHLPSTKRSFATNTSSIDESTTGNKVEAGSPHNSDVDNPEPFEEDPPYPPHLRRGLSRAEIVMGTHRKAVVPSDLISNDPSYDPDPSTFLSTKHFLGTEAVEMIPPELLRDETGAIYVSGAELHDREMEGWVVVVPSNYDDILFEIPEELEIDSMLDASAFLRFRDLEMWSHSGQGLEKRSKIKSISLTELESKLKSSAEDRRKMRKVIRSKWNNIDLQWLDELKRREERRIENLYQIKLEDADNAARNWRGSQARARPVQRQNTPWWKPRAGEVGWSDHALSYREPHSSTTGIDSNTGLTPTNAPLESDDMQDHVDLNNQSPSDLGSRRRWLDSRDD